MDFRTAAWVFTYKAKQWAEGSYFLFLFLSGVRISPVRVRGSPVSVWGSPVRVRGSPVRVWGSPVRVR